MIKSNSLLRKTKIEISQLEMKPVVKEEKYLKLTQICQSQKQSFGNPELTKFQ